MPKRRKKSSKSTSKTALRPLWSGSISFGLVNVPVKMFSAVHHKEVHFHELHKTDGARIREKRVCSKDLHEVPYEDIVKGFEKSRDRYIVVKPSELEALDPKTTRLIELKDFVELSEIDPIYFQHVYYLAPDRAAEKAYALLVHALQASGRVGIGRMVIRSKQYLSAIRAMDGVLSISTLLYHDEIVAPEKLGISGAKAKLTKQELKMAEQLIDSLAESFHPEKYRDTYREKVLKLVERKAKGKKVVEAPAAELPPKVTDFMAALQASLDAAESSSSKTKSKKHAAKVRG